MAQNAAIDCGKDDTMKRIACLAALPLLLAGCEGPRHSDAWEAQKAQCTGGNFNVCADIGHQARADMGGPTQPAQPFILSQPIID
jgi:hypothetical protein